MGLGWASLPECDGFTRRGVFDLFAWVCWACTFACLVLVSLSMLGLQCCMLRHQFGYAGLGLLLVLGLLVLSCWALSSACVYLVSLSMLGFLVCMC